MAFTEEQQAAIEAKGRVIVSASAGSGKTTVMIEKIIRLILSGTEVSDILAVTFTKKAASQMKDKLKRKLVEAINAPETTTEERKVLKKQLADVPCADISTIHSFCSKLIRAHFFDAGVSGDFKIVSGDDAESVALKNRALDKVFEEAYDEDETGDFFKLLSVYWRKKSDRNLRETILKLYETLRQRADYREVLTGSGVYTEADFDKVCEELFALLKKKCRYYALILDDYESYFKANDGEKSAVLAREIKEAFEKIAAAPDYFTAVLTEKASFSAKERATKRFPEYVKKLNELVHIRDKKYGGLIKDLAKISSRDEEKKAFFGAGEIARALAKYILKFDEEYTAVKRERNLLDYNDLEHVSLALLEQERVLGEVRARYSYVFVDEYQDVNPVQEKLLSLVGGENVFLVGDVKQAIYGFRGSKSKYFGEKQAEYSATGGLSLKLSKNFRSSDLVLDAVNEQFCTVMTKETSSVDYANGSVMVKGGRYPEGSGKTVAHILYTEEDLQAEKEEAKAAKERILPVYSVREAASAQKRESIKTAQAIKNIIDEEVGSDFYDVEEGKIRKIRYSDIVVLSRKKQGEIKDVALELSDEGVPVTSAAAVNICEYSEVKTLIDILKLLDNEKQDAPLVSALFSSMGGLNADELTEIRLAFKEEKFFRDACKRYAKEKTNELAGKLEKFYAFYKKLRVFAAVASAGEVLNELLSKTQMEAAILSRENGVGCLKRVRRFIAESVTPEPLTVHEFLERLKNLDYKIEYGESGGENSVQILTMHSSKGLEYPVVIVDGTGNFRGAERAEVVLEERFGLAPKAYDPQEMTRRSTLLRKMYDEKKRAEEVGDELNLYYVALTRAKYALHVLFKEQTEICDVAYAGSFAELTDFSVWEKYLSFGVEDRIIKQEKEVEGGKPDEKLTARIVEEYLRQYPYAGAENLPVKSSATSLMNDVSALSDDEYGAYTLFDDEEDETASQWKSYRGEKTGKEVGIAYHAFLEKFDFSLLFEGAGMEVSYLSLVEKTLEKWREEGVLPPEYLALLSAEKLAEILKNPVFSALDGMTLYKEQQFLATLPLKDVPALYERAVQEGNENILEEELLFQGAIDLLAVGTGGEVQIIDYKYSVKDKAALKAKYAPQLDLYKKATARILKTDVNKIKCSIVNLLRGFQVEMD